MAAKLSPEMYLRFSQSDVFFDARMDINSSHVIVVIRVVKRKNGRILLS